MGGATELGPMAMVMSSSVELRDALRDKAGQLFAILDACDEPLVPEKVSRLGDDRAVSLYRGSAERDYWAIAPYLVRIDEQLFDWVLENLGERPRGIFLRSSADLTTLRKHFRRFLLVRAPDGQLVYFRFYDPRVLPVFLRSLNAAEREDFHGPIDAFFVTQMGDLPCVLQFALSR